MQDETIITEFTQQAEAFNASAVARDAETLDALVRLAAPQAGERWLEAACGPGIISRNLAPRVGEVHGVDLTPAMVELARREAAQAGLGNATFAVGDATALELPTASVDGAIARFTIGAFAAVLSPAVCTGDTAHGHAGPRASACRTERRGVGRVDRDLLCDGQSRRGREQRPPPMEMAATTGARPTRRAANHRSVPRAATYGLFGRVERRSIRPACLQVCARGGSRSGWVISLGELPEASSPTAANRMATPMKSGGFARNQRRSLLSAGYLR